MKSVTPSNPRFRNVINRHGTQKVWNQPDFKWSNHPPRWTDEITDEYWTSAVEISQGHPVSRLGGSEDIGGPFRAWSRKYSETSTLGGPLHFSEWAMNEPLADGVTHHYFLPRAEKPVVTSGNFLYPWEYTRQPDLSEMDRDGTVAISRILPTNPMFGLSAFLGELREGLPKFGVDTWRSRASRARSAGSDYLNAEFGWKPLISDIRKFIHMTRDYESTLRWYVNNSGKTVKRRYDWPVEEERYSGGPWTGYYPAAIGFGTYALCDPARHIGIRKIDGVITRRRWLEAAFTYYLPPQGSVAFDAAVANKLLGWRITPDVLWQLTPWSWAADWFGNFSEVAKNVSAFMSDGLVMPYAYMMEENSIEVTYTLSKVAFKSYPGMHTFSQTFSETLKVRRQATPFGFGFDLSGLTPRQTAITVALGLSRA